MTTEPTAPELSPAWRSLVEELREIATLVSVERVISWDQETLMPPAGATLRADQTALLSGMVHERRTSERFGDLLAECEADERLLAAPRIAVNLREIRRDYDRNTLVPASLVRELTQTTSLSVEAWKKARAANRFQDFAPWVEKVFELTRAKAECLRTHGQELYDPLIDEYEPGMTAAEVERVFAALRAPLTALISDIAGSGRKPDDAPQRVEVPVEKQVEFSRLVLSRLGFDFDAGRLDTSTHPFCMGVGPGDTRMTSRYEAARVLDSLSSSMHEGGHGLYDQGLPQEEWFGLPLGEAVGLAIHESQSRMWENLVGRSLPFWEWALPEAKRLFGATFERFTPDDLYAASNIVEPTLIRVDSDEATYNLHIMLRFDLERAMLSGDLPVADLPGAWRERIRADLGLDVPSDRLGALQDIHWSMGLIGYFPTYTLGNLYAAQLWTAIRRDIPDLHEQFRRGEFGALLGWLRENVHGHGRRYHSIELCDRATGEKPSHEPLLRYLEGKFRPLYGV